MKAKRIAEIKANIKEQVLMLAETLKKEHGEVSAASIIERARIVGNIAMLKAELSAVIQAPVKKNSDQAPMIISYCANAGGEF